MDYEKVKWEIVVKHIYPKWSTHTYTAGVYVHKEWTAFRDEMLFDMGLKFYNPNKSGKISDLYALIVDEKKWILAKLKYGIV